MLFDARMRLKGQGEIIQYTITILLGVIVMVGVSLIIFNLYDRSIRADIEKSLNQVAGQTVDRILKLYEVGKNSKIEPTGNASVLIATDDLRLPDTVSNKNYEIVVIIANPLWANILNVTINNQSVINIINSPSAKVIARSVNDPIISVERDIPNIEATVQGRGDPTNSKLSYYRYRLNGTIYDKIVFGDGTILIDISKIK